MEPIRIISIEATPGIRFAFSLSQRRLVTVPFGLNDMKGRKTRQFIQFNYALPADSAYLEFVVFGGDNKLIKQFNIPAEFCRRGSYQLDWDGFDDHHTYDSSYFVKANLRVILRCDFGSGQEIKELTLKCRYAKVDWLDVLVDRKSKAISATLRVHFKPSRLQIDHPILYDTLHQLALQGISEYWSRHNGNGADRSISLSGSQYNFYLKAVDQPMGAMKTPKIALSKENKPLRSRNWELSRIIFYNGPASQKADAIFKHTAAHEIGHEILLAYGGHVHSKSHKGSSTIISQRPNGKFVYPQNGEIDLMVYYNQDPQQPPPGNFFKHSIASEFDVKSLLWLSQLEVKQI